MFSKILFRIIGLIVFSLFLRVALIAQPIINNVSPNSGKPGVSVIIQGSNFGNSINSNQVRFGGIRGLIQAANVNTLNVLVPYGVSTEKVSVLNLQSGLKTISSGPFIPTFTGGGQILNSSFSKSYTKSFGNAPINIIPADFDLDGKPDLALIGGVLNVIKNKSTPSAYAFSEPLEIYITPNPWDIAVDDFDGDGRLDIASSSTSDNLISVIRNTSATGTISFSTRLDFAAGSSPKALALGDFNNDGKIDIVATNETGNTISVLRNISTVGNISFAPKVDFATGTQPFEVEVGDLDGDGLVDIVVANTNSNSISIFKNTSASNTIAMLPKQDFSSDSKPVGVAIGDIDGDGLLDIVNTNYGSNTVSFFRNAKSGGVMGFNTAFSISAGVNPHNIIIADLDGDTKLDVAFSNSGTNTVSIIKNNSLPGNFILQPKVDYDVQNNPVALAAADLDLDGETDLVNSNIASGIINVLKNKVNEPFISSVSSLTGKADSLITITGTNFQGATSVKFGGTPAKSFTVASATSINAVLAYGSIGDITVTTSYGTAVLQGFVYHRPEITTFDPATQKHVATVTVSGQNFNQQIENNFVSVGSTKANVLTASESVIQIQVPAGAIAGPIRVLDRQTRLSSASQLPLRIQLNNKPGISESALALRNQPLFSRNYGKASLGDFDGDGKSDFAGPDQESIAIYRNISNSIAPLFTTKQSLPCTFQPYAVENEDLNGDGKPDLIVALYSFSNQNTIFTYPNTSNPGTIQFNQPVEHNVDFQPDAIIPADIDNDGRVDLVLSSSNYYSAVAILRNISYNDTIRFQEAQTFYLGDNPFNIQLADIDGDGKLDVVSSSLNSPVVSVVKNQSSLAAGILFGQKEDFAVESLVKGIVIHDIDGDNRNDIVCIRDSSFMSVFRNLTNAGNQISLSAPLDFEVGKDPSAITIVDLDGDTKSDIVIQCNGDLSIALLANRSQPGALEFSNPIKVPSKNNISRLLTADLNMDNYPDLLLGTHDGAYLLSQNQVDSAAFIAAFDPPFAGLGDSVNIYGKNFENIKQVSFGGTPAIGFTILSDTLIRALVSKGAPGDIIIQNKFGKASISGFEHPGPLITSFSPMQGGPGTTVLVKGKQFTGASAISIDNVPVQSFQVITDTTISLVVGAGGTGLIKVTTASGEYSKGKFNYKAPLITSFNPSVGNTGSVITIHGNYFSHIPEKNKVFFGASLAQVISSSPTMLTVIVPSIAESKQITVIVNEKSAQSTKPFTISFPNGGFMNSNSFSGPLPILTGLQPRGITAGDFDNNGKTDFAVIAGNPLTIKIYENISSSQKDTFILKQTLPPSGAELNISTVDINNDGKFDLVCAPGSYPFTVYLNESDSTLLQFGQPIDFQLDGAGRGLAHADFNLDGLIDIVIASSNVTVYKNQSTTTNLAFSALQIAQNTAGDAFNIAVADLDNNGKVDIMTANYSLNSLSIFRNTSVDSIISFAIPVTIPLPGRPTSIASADLDGDGDLDISVSYDNYVVTVLKNNSTSDNINLGPILNLPYGGSIIIAALDVDGDAKPDLVMGSNGVIKNTTINDSLSFGALASFQLNAYFGFAFADFNGDGKQDFIGTDNGASMARIVYNQVGQLLQGQICINTSATLNAGIAGTSYLWQLLTDTGYIDLMDGVNYIGSNTSILTIKTIPTSWLGNEYRCKVDDTFSEVTKISSLNIWTPAVSNEWGSTSNWSCNILPDQNSEVIISSGKVIINSNVTVKTLTVAPGVELIILPGIKITLIGQ